jgi:hypothetical protein
MPLELACISAVNAVAHGQKQEHSQESRQSDKMTKLMEVEQDNDEPSTTAGMVSSGIGEI